jgi:carbonic anhydrase
MSKNIKQLIKGYQEFQSHYFDGQNSTYDQLVRDGQKPNVMIIACSDSRVDPAIVLNCEPGDLFVVRNVANLVPPYENDQGYHGTSAALEFAVGGLGVQHIILFGHSQCGGIRSLVEQHETHKQHSFISKWMGIAEGAYQTTMKHHGEQALDERCEICAQQALVNSLENLKTFPWIIEKIKAGALELHAWYFDLSTGIIHAYDAEKGSFSDLASNFSNTLS